MERVNLYHFIQRNNGRFILTRVILASREVMSARSTLPTTQVLWSPSVCRHRIVSLSAGEVCRLRDNLDSPGSHNSPTRTLIHLGKYQMQT